MEHLQTQQGVFGIATGARVLTQLMDQVFSDIKFKFVSHYPDGIVIYIDSFEDHIGHLYKVFHRLLHVGLTVNLIKVKFATLHFSFVGHTILPLGVSVDPDRTKVIRIRNLPPQHDVRGIARFMGMVFFFHKFIPQFAELATPLNLLHKKNVKFVWGSIQQCAFEDLKLAINKPVLCTANFSCRFIMQTDTFFSAVLLKVFDGNHQPIAHASHTLSPQERKFSSYELECFVVLFILEKFRPLCGACGVRP
jgi:hypothetical protein